MAKLFIGMPVYNGESYISEAVESIINQKFTDWVMLISDNNSTDSTQDICFNYTKEDNRIRYYQQKANFGAVNNFKFVLDQADTEYFMWASHDDIWDCMFVESCLSKLESDPNYGFSFSNIVNIDKYGRVNRYYPGFEKFNNPNRVDSITNFFCDPEDFGKANIFYSIYRTNVLKDNVQLLSERRGSDVTLVLSILLRNNLYIEHEVLFKKRLIRSSDSIDKLEVDNMNEDNYRYIYPIDQFNEFVYDQLQVVYGTSYYNLAKKIFQIRKELVYERNIVDNLINDMLILKKENENLKSSFKSKIKLNILLYLNRLNRLLKRLLS